MLNLLLVGRSAEPNRLPDVRRLESADVRRLIQISSLGLSVFEAYLHLSLSADRSACLQIHLLWLRCDSIFDHRLLCLLSESQVRHLYLVFADLKHQLTVLVQ